MPVVDNARSVYHSTSPPLEGAVSVYATLPLPLRTTKGPDSRPAGVGMVYELFDAVRARWRRLNDLGVIAGLVGASITWNSRV